MDLILYKVNKSVDYILGSSVILSSLTMEREYTDDNTQRQFNNLRLILAHEDIEKSLQYTYLYFIHFNSLKGSESAQRNYVLELSQPFETAIRLIKWIGFDHVITKRRLTARQLAAAINRHRKEFDELGCRNLESGERWPTGKIVKFVSVYLTFMFDCEITSDGADRAGASETKTWGIVHDLLPLTNIRPFWRDNLIKIGTEKHIHIIQKPSSKNLIVNCPITYKRHLQYIIKSAPNINSAELEYFPSDEI